MSNVRRVDQNGAAEGVALVHTLYGTPVQGVGGTTHTNGNIQPAGLHSTAPYRPPKRRQRDNPDVILCSYEDCKAFPIKKTGYCAGHSRKLGLVDWAKGGRGHKKEQDHDDTDAAASTGASADGDD